MTIEGRGVQAIDVGGRILAALVSACMPLTLRDLSARADVAPGQAHAYLVSFRNMGLVEQEPNTSRYQLGHFALHLGLARMRSFSPLKMAHAAAVALCAETGKRIIVGVWGSHGATAVQVEEGADDLHIDLRPGKVHSLLKTATGKVFAAYLPRAIVEPKLFVEIKDWDRHQFVGEAPTLDQWVHLAQDVRTKGYATTNGDPAPGISTLSAPVLDGSGQIQFSLTMVGASRALDVSAESLQTRRILAFTAELSSQLGYLPHLVETARQSAPAAATRSKASTHLGKTKVAADPSNENEATPARQAKRRRTASTGKSAAS